jgi:hypothetical protein
MAANATRPPRSLDESVVAYLEHSDGCVTSGDGVFPPPKSCSDTVHVVYGFAAWHLFSILVAFLFMAMMFSLTMGVLGKDEHH